MYIQKMQPWEKGGLPRPAMDGNEHNPQYAYDCGNCKFSWCCGFTCGCIAQRGGKLPDPPIKVQLSVNGELMKHGFYPQFSTVRRPGQRRY
jgi:hypothetical protein